MLQLSGTHREQLGLFLPILKAVLLRVAWKATAGTGTFADGGIGICFGVQREYLLSMRVGEV
jgi:hypothetical protein